MRVTYLLSDLGGGTGHHLLDLLRSRPQDSWQAEIVSEVPSTSRMQLPVVHRVLEAPTGSARFPIRQIQRYRQLASLFNLKPPDILHTYFFWSIIYGRLLKMNGIVSRLIENREDLGFDWGPVEYAMLAATRRIPDRVICVSDAVRRVVLDREGIPPHRIDVVRNGIFIDAPIAEPRVPELREELGIGPANQVIIMVANFDRPIKGARYFLESIPRIRAAVPDARYILLGGGKTASELQERARELGIDGVLLMPGFREDVERFYALSDVSVLTSLSEGLSITILESMRSGVPVVVTDVGGNPEIVRNGETGLLVPPRDPRSLSDAVIWVLRDAVARSRFSKSSRELVKRDFDLRTVVGKYAQVYSEVMSG